MTTPQHAPAVSVITPSYNYADFIGSCLASVIRQDAHSMHVQHVVVDDGSTDESWPLIQRLHPSPGDDCRRQDNGGLSNALNAALTLARGEWLVWLNADDLLLPWTLRLVQDTLSRHPDADVVFGDTLFVDEAARLIRMVGQPAFRRDLFTRGYNAFHTPSVFWRRSLLPEGWQFDETMKLLMDLDLWLTITADARQIVKIDHPLSAFRRHERQTSGTSRPSDAEEMCRLAARHGLHRLSSSSSSDPPFTAKMFHGWLKLREGLWWREAMLRRHAGMGTDWTRDADVTNLRPRRPPMTRATALQLLAGTVELACRDA